ncbi:hypothetical protein CBR_g42 [Chara braunii]|uniref:Uncharacterized protein n=1 Tax=Chara braunii TaxID=69332 RepID=A0A388JLQ1_CHABU|nr:hypothetical protein CBR_g42 [Chara braunii]|eukprot:GBG58642.1 hypothetical protein CBR_g42 [Chara braunii]
MYDKFGYYIDVEIPGGSRKEALRRVEAGEPPSPLAMFRIWQEEDVRPDVRVEEIGENKEVKQERKAGTVKEEPIVVESDEEIERGYWNAARRTMEIMEDLVAKMRRYQDKLTNMCEEVKEWKDKKPLVYLYDMGPRPQGGSWSLPGVTISRPTPRSGMAYRPPSRSGGAPQAVRTRAKGPVSPNEPAKDVPEPSGEKETVDIPQDEDERDERLRREEGKRTELRAKKRDVKADVERVPEGKKRKYVVRVEEDYDVEEMMDRILEGHNHLMNLKDVLTSAPRFRDELKTRLSRKMVASVRLRAIIPKEAEWAETEVRSFLGTCGFWRVFIKGFAAKTEQLRKLVRQGQDWEWGDKQESVIEALKKEFEEGGLRIPGNKNRADGLSRVDWDKSNKGVIEDTPLVDGFLDKEEDVKLHINSWSLAIGNYVTPGRPVWLAPPGHVRRPDIVPKPYIEEDSWGMPELEWMMELALADKYQLREDLVTLETGPQQVEKDERLVGGMYVLANSLLQEEVARIEEERQDREENVIHEGEDDDFEEGLTPFGEAMPRGREGQGQWNPLRRQPDRECRDGPGKRTGHPSFRGGNVELFFVEFEKHANKFRWDGARMLRKVRGGGEWAEAIARYVRESVTWQEFERKMEGIHPSPVGRDGVPIRFDGTNLDEFLWAYDRFADEQNIAPKTKVRGFLQFVRRPIRMFVRNIVERALHWGDCRRLLRSYYTPTRQTEERRSMEKKRKEPEVTERRTFESA